MNQKSLWRQRIAAAAPWIFAIWISVIIGPRFSNTFHEYFSKNSLSAAEAEEISEVLPLKQALEVLLNPRGFCKIAEDGKGCLVWTTIERAANDAFLVSDVSLMTNLHSDWPRLKVVTRHVPLEAVDNMLCMKGSMRENAEKVEAYATEDAYARVTASDKRLPQADVSAMLDQVFGFLDEGVPGFLDGTICNSFHASSRSGTALREAMIVNGQPLGELDDLEVAEAEPILIADDWGWMTVQKK